MTTPPSGMPPSYGSQPPASPYGQQPPLPPHGQQPPPSPYRHQPPYGQAPGYGPASGYPATGYGAPGYGPAGGYGALPYAPGSDAPTYSGYGLVGAVKAVLSKYATFTGRATRSEFWFFYLGVILAYAVLIAFALIAAAGKSGGLAVLFIALYFVVGFGVILPALAAGVRRLHDTGKSGALLLLGLIPFVGGIIVLVLLAQPSQPVPNMYGPAPQPLPQQ